MEKFAKQLRENWVIFTLLAALVIWYAGVNTRLTQAEVDIKDLKTTSQKITDIEIRLERIDTTVQFIKDKVK